MIYFFLNVSAFRLAADRNNYEIINFLFSVSKPKMIDHTFKGCKKLTQISFPSSVRSIVECAFLECSSLRQVTIPSSVRKIDAIH